MKDALTKSKPRAILTIKDLYFILKCIKGDYELISVEKKGDDTLVVEWDTKEEN